MGKTSALNLIGQKFNRLTVIKRVENDKYYRTQWLCICDCGNEKYIIVTGHSLKTGNTKSCGCYAHEYHTKIRVDITGQKFGRLTAIKRMYVKDNCVYWLCKCDCDGSENIYSLANLTSGNTKSCGCYKKETSIINGKNNKKYNTYDLSGEFGIGYTTKREEFYFDLEDYDLIKDYCWYYDANGYVITKHNGLDIRQHRLIMNVNDEREVDHICHIIHDNRKCQLRIVDKSKNQINSKTPSDNKSGCKGVYWHKLSSKWAVQLTVNKNKMHLGLFSKIDEAIKVRKEAEQKYHGEYSYDNSMNKNKEKLEGGI